MLTQKEMEDAFIPLLYRDKCAELLIELNECRFETFGLPWKCGAKRNAYQKCQADEYAVYFSPQFCLSRSVSPLSLISPQLLSAECTRTANETRGPSKEAWEMNLSIQFEL